jgi:hypothetical protein
MSGIPHSSKIVIAMPRPFALHCPVTRINKMKKQEVNPAAGRILSVYSGQVYSREATAGFLYLRN